MGSVHGKAGPPIELQALPEAWGEGTKRKQIPDTPPLQSPVKERVISLGAEDIKIESVEEVGTAEVTTPEETENETHSDSSNKISILTPADVSITSRRTMTKSASPRPKSNGSYSWNRSMENEGSADHLSVTSYNMIRTIRSSCRASKGLLDYSDMMFKEMLRKLELMHTNTRMRLIDDIARGEERREEQFTDISNEIKDLKHTMEKHSKLLKIQQINGQSSKHRVSQRNALSQTNASSQNVAEKTPRKDFSRLWSRAATSVVRRADSQCAPAPTTKPSRIPVAVPDATIRSMFFNRSKSENVGNIQDRPEQQYQQATGNSSTSLFKQQHRAGSGAVRKYQQKQRNISKGKQINILEHKKGPKLAQYR